MENLIIQSLLGIRNETLNKIYAIDDVLLIYGINKVIEDKKEASCSDIRNIAYAFEKEFSVKDILLEIKKENKYVKENKISYILRGDAERGKLLIRNRNEKVFKYRVAK